ncbi:hypothetical protein TNCV_2065571 [Trichonephila clavipes]|nr:hypothetical protein TNCV_2065571 [Trichonephila clavipes]
MNVRFVSIIVFRRNLTIVEAIISLTLTLRSYIYPILFASLHFSFLGFGWKRVVINSGPKNPKDLLKKRRVSRHKLHANFHPLSQIEKHYHLVYSKFRYLKVCSFASFIHTSLLGFGWKRVAHNSGLKNPKDMLKKRRVSPSQA